MKKQDILEAMIVHQNEHLNKEDQLDLDVLEFYADGIWSSIQQQKAKQLTTIENVMRNRIYNINNINNLSRDFNHFTDDTRTISIFLGAPQEIMTELNDALTPELSLNEAIANG